MNYLPARALKKGLSNLPPGNQQQHRSLIRIILLVLFFLYCRFASAQNIIPNNSFEDINTCAEFKAACSPAAWFFVAQKAAKGYFSLNHIPGTSGNKYLSIAIARPDSSRQYWETMLLCKLQAGETYTVKIKLAFQDTGATINDLGLYFTNSLIFSRNDTLLQPAAYLNLSGAVQKKLKYNWIEAEKQFIAERDDPFLVIGNFSKQSNSEIIAKRKLTGSYAILVDEISITPAKKISCDGIAGIRDSLYSITNRHSHFPEPTTANYSPPTPPVPQKIDTLVLNNILFAFNSYVLRDKDIFDQYAQLFNGAAIKKIHITGFTDDAGTEAYNRLLSQKRAKEVAGLIAQKFGVPPAVIETEGRGISKDYTDKKNNRRVVVYIYH